jgi:transcription antitermination factor NusG
MRARKNQVSEFQWFVLRVMTGRESMVGGCLKRRGFATFLPRQKVYRYANGAARLRRRKHERSYPLLPGYVFVGLSPETPTWAGVFDLTPVLCVIGRDGVPTVVAVRALEKLVARYGRGEFDAPAHHRHIETHREFSVGESVITGDGLIQGRVREISGTTAKIFVDILGSERLIEADLGNLVAA